MALTVDSQEKTPGTFHMTIQGRLDAVTSPTLEAAVKTVLGKAPKVLVFDLKGVDYLSSMGVRVIFQTHKSMRLADGKLLMVNLQPMVQKVLEIVNAMPESGIFKTEADMDAYLDAVQKGTKK